MKKSKSKSQFLILTGLRASLLTKAKRPQSISALYYSDQAKNGVKDLLEKKPGFNPKIIKKVPEMELKKISGGISHEGVAMKITPPPFKNLKDFSPTQNLILALDHVDNPHNYGTIFRIASFFGIKNILQENHPDQAKPSGSSMRVSQGGIELLNIYQTNSLESTLLHLKKIGFSIVGTSLKDSSLDYHLVKPKKLVLVLGNEEEGIRPQIEKICDQLVIIPREGEMESLNVAVATGILLEHFHKI